jgi:putative endonuclease
VVQVQDMNYVYILKSNKDLKRYVGLTNNLERRISLHNDGKVQATKNRRPFELIYFEEIEDRIVAVKREKFLKSGKGREFLNSILK